MWSCPKCGEKIEDQFDSCWKCAAQPGQAVPEMPTNTDAKRNELPKKPPFFGVLSLVLPLLGIPFAYTVTPSSQAGWGWGGAVELVVIIFASFLLGLVSAVIGIIRSEKYIVLSWIGFLLNGLPILLAFIL